MNIIDYILVFFLSGYFLQVIVFTFGAWRARYPAAHSGLPSVSVVVAARNEENNIGRCLSSLAKTKYDPEKLEFIIVNDHSTDATEQRIRAFAASDLRFRLLNAAESDGHLQGKANAIAQGIDIARGEIIMMTDADCAVQPGWVDATARSFEKKTGIVAGITLLDVKNWFHGLQNLDWALMLAVASAAMWFRYPLTCIGNNFSFRRTAYDEAGGYRKIKFSVTEDFSLFKAIALSGSWNCRFPITKETLVISKPCDTISQLYQQKRRWSVGGLEMRPSAFLIMVFAYVMHAFLLFGILLPITTPIYLSIFAAKLSADFLLIAVPLVKTGMKSQLKYFLIFESYYIISVVVIPFAVFFGGKVHWKGRSY